MKRNRKPRIVPSTSELIEFSREHLYYEIWMLYEVSELLKSAQQGLPMTNALLESFVIHAAGLIEFFYDKGAHKNIARVSDYLRNPSEWKGLIPPYSRYSNKLRNRRHIEMAHLSYARAKVDPKDKGWYHGIITMQLRVIVNQFLDNADPNKIHPKLYHLRTKFPAADSTNEVIKSWEFK